MSISICIPAVDIFSLDFLHFLRQPATVKKAFRHALQKQVTT